MADSLTRRADCVAHILPPRLDAQSSRAHPLLLPFGSGGATLDVVADWDPETVSTRYAWYVRSPTEAALHAQVAQLDAAMPGITVEYPVRGSDPGSVGADERAVGVALSPRDDDVIVVPIPARQNPQIVLAALLGRRVLRPGERVIARLHGQAADPKARRRVSSRRESDRLSRTGEGAGRTAWLPDDVWGWAAVACLIGVPGYAALGWLRALPAIELMALAALVVAVGSLLWLAARAVWRSRVVWRARAPKLPDRIIDGKLDGTLVSVHLEVLGIGPADADLGELRKTVQDVADAWEARTGSGLRRIAFDPRRGYPQSRPGRPLLLTEEEAGAVYPSPLAVPPSQGTERGGSRRLRPPPPSDHDGIDIGYVDA